MKTYTSPERKLKKVMVEKRRRTRIDRALIQMKNMVLEALHVQPEKYAKMEKADILDLTVRFLRRVRQERHAAVTSQDPRQMFPAAAQMYPGYASAAAAAATTPYPFKMAPLRPIPTTLPGHPYAHIGNLPRGPFRPTPSHRLNPMKPSTSCGATPQMTSLPVPSHDSQSSLPATPRRVPTATVTSSEVAEASSTSRGPDSPPPAASSLRDVTAIPKPAHAHSSIAPRTSSPCSTVTSSSERKADSNNNNSERPSNPSVSGPSGSRPGSETEARRHQIEAPIPLRMIKFDHVQDFPLFGPGVWRPWFA